MSSFHGLEMAKQALFAQQRALYTTGHNISNANTDGYSRQRVNFETTAAYPTPGRNRPEMPGQMGTGVQVGSVQRMRSEFLDIQYRGENSRSDYWDTKADALSRMESLLNEPSDSGLSKTMKEMWQSLQDLGVNPDNSGARSVVAQRGLAVAETFNHLSKSLKSIQNDLKSEIDVTAKNKDTNALSKANSLLRQIDNMNEQIKKVEPHGYLANDLYDDRDRLIDELSGIVNIHVTYDKSSNSSLDMAGGLVTIEVVNNEGKSFDNRIFLVNGKHGDGEQGYSMFDVKYNEEETAVKEITVGEKKLDFMNSDGSLKGLIEAFGYMDGDEIKGEYPKMIAELDKMAQTFAVEFNKVHQTGRDLDNEPGEDFFKISDLDSDDSTGAAGKITVSEDVLKSPNLIAAGAVDKGSRNGDNAFALGDVFDDRDIGLGDNTSVNSFFESVIGNLGVEAGEALRMSNNTDILRSQVQEQRMSMSAVSLDEEMTNMIKFQHAYNAAARSMTTVDEMLDRIINGMGLVGR